MSDTPAKPRDAATVVVLRDRVDRRAIEAFLVRRHGASGFMAGAHVFPGGKVDPADLALEPRVRSRDLEATLAGLSTTPGRARPREVSLALFVAAVREVHEEAGLLLARRAEGGALDAGALARIAAARGGDPPFPELLSREGLVLELDLLAPWAHWITPSAEPKRFDTHFFLARAPADQVASEDAHETTESAWMTPIEALERHERGEIFLPPPTLVTLDELSSFDSVDAAFAGAARRRVAAILPKLGGLDDRIAIVMPWDSRYAAMEGESFALEGPHPTASRYSCVVYDGERWRPATG